MASNLRLFNNKKSKGKSLRNEEAKATPVKVSKNLIEVQY